MAVIIFIALHTVFCICMAVLKLTHRLKSRNMTLPAACLLPVCGMITALVDEWQVRHGRLGVRKVDDYTQLQGDEAWHREIVGTYDDALTVPLEEAMTVNDSHVSRKLMMKLLHTSPENYVELLKKVTTSDDVELTHYAATAMMEIQSDYERRIGEILDRVKRTPDDVSVLMQCTSRLKAYIDSGLISDTVLMQYRLRLDEILSALCPLVPDAVRFEYECIENRIMLEKYEGIDKRLAALERKYPEDGRVYMLYVQYYYSIHSGGKIEDTLRRMKERGVYLDSAGKEWLQVWT